VDCLAPFPDDVVIEGKRGLCGFASTNLVSSLDSRGTRLMERMLHGAEDTSVPQ